MPIQTLQPLAVGDLDLFDNVGGADKVASTRAPDDDATSYISSEGLGPANIRQTFTMTNLHHFTIAVNSMELRFRYTGTITGLVRRAATTGTDATQGPDAAWTTRSSGAMNDPVSGVTPTIAEVNDMQAGVKKDGLLADQDYVSTINLLIDTEIAGHGFAFIVGSIVGAALDLGHMAGLARWIHRASGILVREWEYPKLLADLRLPRRRYA